MCLGVFFVFLGSLFELGENIPTVQDYLSSGNIPWGEFTKLVLYIVGVVLIIFSPISWLPLILEGRSRLKQLRDKSTELGSFLSELNGSVNQVEKKQASSYLLNTALAHLCAELKTESGAIFLFLNNTVKRELALTKHRNQRNGSKGSTAFVHFEVLKISYNHCFHGDGKKPPRVKQPFVATTRRKY